MNKNTVAFDKASARHYDDNGFLIVDSDYATCNTDLVKIIEIIEMQKQDNKHLIQ